MINIINSHDFNAVTHEYIKDLSGAIKLDNINTCLDYIVYTNQFNNRPKDASGNFLLSTTPYWQPILDGLGRQIYLNPSSTIYYKDPSSQLLTLIDGTTIAPTGVHYYPQYYSGNLVVDGNTNQVYKDASGIIYYVQLDGSLKDVNGNTRPYGDQTYPLYEGVVLDISNGNVVYHDTQNILYYLQLDGITYKDVSGNVGIAAQLFPHYQQAHGIPILDVDNRIVYQPLYDIANGFLEGDLIFLPNGFQVTLKLDILNNSIDLNQIGFSNVAAFEQSTNVNQQATLSQGFKSVSTIADDKKIVTTINVPLLIKLKNLTNGPKTSDDSSFPYPIIDSLHSGNAHNDIIHLKNDLIKPLFI